MWQLVDYHKFSVLYSATFLVNVSRLLSASNWVNYFSLLYRLEVFLERTVLSRRQHGCVEYRIHLYGHRFWYRYCILNCLVLNHLILLCSCSKFVCIFHITNNRCSFKGNNNIVNGFNGRNDSLHIVQRLLQFENTVLLWER